MTPPLLTTDVLRETIAGLGFELVDVRVGGSTSKRVVRIRMDVPGGGRPGHGVTSSDCQLVSRTLEAALEAIRDATLVYDWSRQGNREAGEP